MSRGEFPASLPFQRIKKKKPNHQIQNNVCVQLDVDVEMHMLSQEGEMVSSVKKCLEINYGIL